MTKTAAARDFKLIDVRAEANRMVADNPLWANLQRATTQVAHYCAPTQPEEVRQGTMTYLGRLFDEFLAPGNTAALGAQAVDFQRRVFSNWEKQCRFEIDYNTSTFHYPSDITPEARFHAAVAVEKFEEQEKRAQQGIVTLDAFAAEVDAADIGAALLVDMTARVAEEGMAEGAASLLAKIESSVDATAAVRRVLASSSSDVLFGDLRQRTLPKPTVHASLQNLNLH